MTLVNFVACSCARHTFPVQVVARDRQIADLQQMLDRNTAQLGEKVSSRDAAVETLQSQLELQRRQVGAGNDVLPAGRHSCVLHGAQL